MFRNVVQNQDGIGLIAAIFIIVVVALFGVLIARYTMISSQASAEDFLWSQALYSAESAAQLRILEDDNGGPTTWGWNDPTINNFSTTITGPDLIDPAGNIRLIRSRASRANITRTVEVKYDLSP